MCKCTMACASGCLCGHECMCTYIYVRACADVCPPNCVFASVFRFHLGMCASSFVCGRGCEWVSEGTCRRMVVCVV